MYPSKIIVALTGSIACYKACELISLLIKKGFDVQTVASTSALEFVGEATLEGLTRKPVLTSPLSRSSMMQHIDLPKWADALVIAPATANTINSMAAGLASDLLGNILLAWEPQKPLLVVPAMNQKMWAHPSVQKSIDQLKSWHHVIVPPTSGNLACGETGLGRLAEPEVIFSQIVKQLNPQGKKVLITAGGTQEPLDDVRCISNNSSGRTGLFLAERLFEAGFNVTLLKSGVLETKYPDISTLPFRTFDDLDQQLRKVLSETSFDFVLHAAAVSDFRVKEPLPGKIKSTDELNLSLVPNEKLLSKIKTYSLNPDLKVIGFKLTSGATEDEIASAVKRQMLGENSDWVLHNDLKLLSDTSHHFSLFDPTGVVATGPSKSEMANQFIHLLRDEGVTP
ncbi:MAG: bifunctional phosphopantothenoylcysteine decarboxylase/phosphopantothenate--cysteine ligase CoaBC [Pseudobdellovibrionaceae bacterium]|nr:bifunctional phosphopantothenoylcysteine decarboxylase/phosphopantothenate--cysteine ligase CoaBC [Bdellovibrionales bacterium]USN47133.1 MAG: bifunctional phosphopantothenoylcysteine decarboxylase/phosphopantothenate--cysteine ligase CoaBC [Pseudobdellovibrionaceae bacterium]